MTQEKIEELKNLLLAEQSTLETSLSQIAVKDGVSGVWGAVPDTSEGQESDSNDLADRAEGFEERSSLVSTLSIRLSEVESALAKIVDGSYGICDVSGEEIEEERLFANPAASTCIEHMEQ